jgi:hypothetical protein
MLGNRRGGHEPPEVIGKPVIWLSDCVLRGEDFKFCHEVQIMNHDPNLVEDSGFTQTGNLFANFTGAEKVPRFFWYLVEIKPFRILDL